MKKLSISFTLGKASVPHGTNVEHNNRRFIARNIDPKRTADNVTYVRQDVEDAYRELFQQAVDEYNQDQKQPCRRISDYYKHISESRREEAFYEIIVQFGDSKTAPCGSETANVTKQMLDEYIRSFRERNPNLYIFNAVMHMDEASPHLHINFIPFYTQGRKNGLRKGVSMKAALNEQGFTASNFKDNRLVAWEESERIYMESILQRHGFYRDDKQAKYAHQTVEEFKKAKDEKKMAAALRSARNISSEDMQKENVQRLRSKLQQTEQEMRALKREKYSPYRSFFYSVPDKQAFVQAKLDEMQIPYRETENGFEAQECYVEIIRKLEKEFKAPRSTAREKLREDIDRSLMQSDSLEMLLQKLKDAGYTVKQGKYLSVRPKNSSQFIRLKSLGEFYSEYALRNRIKAKKKYEAQIEEKIMSGSKKGSSGVFVLRTIQLYTVAFKNGALPMRKRDKQRPYAWTNDSEVDKLLALNQKINAGLTLENLKQEFAEQQKAVSEKEKALEKSKADLKTFQALKEQISVVFEGKKSAVFSREQAEKTLRLYPTINESNYQNIEILIRNEIENIQKLKETLLPEQEQLKTTGDLLAMAEKVMGGTYVQTLVGEERERRGSDLIPNGLRPA